MNPTLDSYIAQLLFEYDCVVVPQFGGFVTSYRPAILDEQQGLAWPPGKELRFNRNLSKNDGLLATACADDKGWTFAEADAYISAEVQRYWAHLHEGSKLRFKKVGILYIDQHRNVRFEPDTEQNFLKHSWGFEPFALPKTIQKAAIAPEAKVIPMPEVKHHSPKTSEEAEPVLEGEESTYGRSEHTRSIYWVAAATLLPFIAFSLFMGAKTGFKSPAELSPADLNPFAGKKAVERLYKPMSGSDLMHESMPLAAFPEGQLLFPYSFAKGEIDSTAVWVNLAGVERPQGKSGAQGSPSAEVATSLSHSGSTYHIIGGCFAEKANANTFIAQMGGKGYHAEILDYHKGLHRVKVGSFDDYGSAVFALENLRAVKSFEGAWMLKKSMKP